MSEDSNRVFKLKVDFIPPSENRIRVIRVIKGKPAGMAWTKEAKHFKKQFKGAVQETKALEAALFSSGHEEGDVYELFIEMGTDLINKTYGRKNGAAYRYKRMDIANRRKLLEDALSEVLSIDDSLFFRVTMEKQHSEEPYLRVILHQTSPSFFGVEDG